MSESLYDKYGGYETVFKLVSNFYAKINRNPQVMKYFTDTDMTTLIEHQSRFISYILGSPDKFEVDLNQIHQPMKISDEHFVVVKDLLKSSMEELEMEAEDIENILIVIEGTKNSIVFNG